MKAELGQLGVPASPDKKAGESQWEADLQAELHDLELQGIEAEGDGGGGGGSQNDEAWEAELEQMLDLHSEPVQD